MCVLCPCERKERFDVEISVFYVLVKEKRDLMWKFLHSYCPNLINVRFASPSRQGIFLVEYYVLRGHVGYHMLDTM